jgi:hypothetical protein
VDRELIYSTLFTRLSTLTSGVSPLFMYATRNLFLWEKAAPEDMPAILQTQRTEAVTKVRGRPPIWELKVNVFVYVYTGNLGDSSVVPSTLLNPLIDAITDALSPDDLSNEAYTLGGLVSSCYIDGTLETFEGNLGNEAMVIIPITMTVPT